MSQIWQVSEGILRDGDVLLEVDGYPIAPDGTVMLPEAPSLRLGILRHRVQRVAGGLKLGYADRDPDPSQHHPPGAPRSATRKGRGVASLESVAE